MSKKITIDLIELRRFLEYKRNINTVELEDIQWTVGEEVLEIDPQSISHWCFTGLSNVDFGVQLLQQGWDQKS